MIKNITVSKEGKFLFNRRIVKESDVILKNGDTFTGETGIDSQGIRWYKVQGKFCTADEWADSITEELDFLIELEAFKVHALLCVLSGVIVGIMVKLIITYVS